MSSTEKEDRGAELVEGPAARLSSYLSEHGIEHELIEHPETMTARSEAREAHVPAAEMAKAVLLAEADEYLLAVVPASSRLDLEKTRELIGRAGVRLATESELAVLSPELELGALPILGPDVPATEVIDRGLLEHQRILCSAGDHRHAVSFPPGALMKVMEPIVADICAD